jgi:hypothetical protein
MKVIAVALFALFFSLLAVATITRGGDAQPKSTLADQINSACKPGYRVNDWTAGDEFNPLPPGQVKVTCAHTKEPFDIYYVAVER